MTIMNLTKAEARFVEQYEMIKYHTIKTGKIGCNKINGLSPMNKNFYLYYAAVYLSGALGYLDNQYDNANLNILEGNL